MSVALGAPLMTACGATSTESVSGPVAAKCGVTLAVAPDPVQGTGGTGTVAVTTEPECSWTAASDASWITEVAPVSGQGSGQLQFRISTNPNGTSREGGINVNNQRAIVRQAAAPCQVQAAISGGQFAAAGGTATVTVTARSGCAWTASANVGWINLAPPASGSGDGTVTVAISQNTSAARSGTIIVAGVDLQISQAAGGTGSPPAPSCSVSLLPTSLSMPGAGGPGSVAITTNAGCTWTATSGVPWITITPPASGSGSGSKAFTVATNTSATPRSGNISIAGATLTVNQAAAACAPPSINPTSQSIAGSGGGGTPVAVTAGTGCAWTATSNAAWLTITSGASGTGNGTVGFSVAANTVTFRTGTLTIAGQTFTVNQAACTYDLDRPAQVVGGDGAVGVQVTVTTQAGCPWGSAASDNWLHITSGASGTGNGNVTFSVDSFGGSSRTGTLAIAARTFTVVQERCTASLVPENQPVSSLGGAFSVTLTTQNGCHWTASSNAVWLTMTSATSGTNSSTVNYLVLPNPGGARTGRLTFVLSGEEERLTVNQEKN